MDTLLNTPDVYALSKNTGSTGVTFKKKPDEGRMKGLAFAYDADRCWVEIGGRSESTHKNVCNFSQVMLRIKEPKNPYRSIVIFCR